MSRQTHKLSERNEIKRPYTVRATAVTIGIATFTCLTLIAFLLTGQVAAQGSSESGQAIFEQKCVACHTIGGGITVGPDLQGVTERRDRDWLLRWVIEPDKMLAEGDPIATGLLAEFNNIVMPPLGLSYADAEALMAYLENPGSTGTAVALTLPQGNELWGEAFFTGRVTLENRGPACISCHSTAEISGLGGGTLGPDLTNVYERYGAAGLPQTLQSLPFPTMEGVFGDKPLTTAEAADLYAYFVQTNQAAQTAAQPPVSSNFVWISLGGFVVLGLLTQLIWRKRLIAVRQPLLGGAK
jgi:cytochrome c2